MVDKKSGIDRVFMDVFQRYKNRLYSYSCRMIGDKDKAADIIQDVFIAYYRCLSKGQTITLPQNWLLVAARNRCLNAIRNDKKIFHWMISKYPQVFTRRLGPLNLIA